MHVFPCTAYALSNFRKLFCFASTWVCFVNPLFPLLVGVHEQVPGVIQSILFQLASNIISLSTEVQAASAVPPSLDKIFHHGQESCARWHSRCGAVDLTWKVFKWNRQTHWGRGIHANVQLLGGGEQLFLFWKSCVHSLDEKSSWFWHAFKKGEQLLTCPSGGSKRAGPKMLHPPPHTRKLGTV